MRLAVSLALFLSSLSLGAEKKASIRWTPLAEAAQSAPANGKYIFVDVYTDWCAYCKKLDATTYQAGSVIAELDKHFISVKLNAESDAEVIWKGRKTTARALSELWRVDGFPTLLFLNAKGEIIGSFSSYAEPDLMVRLLTYISSGARERKISFDNYLKGSS